MDEEIEVEQITKATKALKEYNKQLKNAQASFVNQNKSLKEAFKLLGKITDKNKSKETTALLETIQESIKNSSEALGEFKELSDEITIISDDNLKSLDSAKIKVSELGAHMKSLNINSATDELADELTDVVNNINNASKELSVVTDNINSASKEFTELANNTNNATNKFTDVVNSINDATKGFVDTTDSINNATKGFVDTASNISSASNEFANVANDISNTTKQFSVVTDNINDASKDFTDTASNISSASNEFTNVANNISSAKQNNESLNSSLKDSNKALLENNNAALMVANANNTAANNMGVLNGNTVETTKSMSLLSQVATELVFTLGRMTTIFAGGVGFLSFTQAIKDTISLNNEMTALSVRMGKGIEGIKELEGAVTNLQKKYGAAFENAKQYVGELSRLHYTGDIEEAAAGIDLFTRATGASSEATMDLIDDLNKVGKIGADGANKILVSMTSIQQSMGLSAKGMEAAINTTKKITTNMLAFGKTSQEIVNVTAKTTALTAALEKVGVAATETTQFIDNLLDPEKIEDNILLYSQLGISMQDAMNMDADTMMSSVGSQLQDVAQKIVDMGPIVGKEFGKQMGISFTTAKKMINADFGEFSQQAEEASKTTEEKTLDVLNEMMSKAEGFGKKIEKGLNKFQGILRTLPLGILVGLAFVTPAITKIVSNLFTKIKKNFSVVADETKKQFSVTTDAISDTFSMGLKKALDTTNAGIVKIKNSAVGWVGTLFDSTAVGEFFNGTENRIDALQKRIKNNNPIDIFYNKSQESFISSLEADLEKFGSKSTETFHNLETILNGLPKNFLEDIDLAKVSSEEIFQEMQDGVANLENIPKEQAKLIQLLVKEYGLSINKEKEYEEELIKAKGITRKELDLQNSLKDIVGEKEKLQGDQTIAQEKYNKALEEIVSKNSQVKSIQESINDIDKTTIEGIEEAARQQKILNDLIEARNKAEQQTIKSKEELDSVTSKLNSKSEEQKNLEQQINEIQDRRKNAREELLKEEAKKDNNLQIQKNLQKEIAKAKKDENGIEKELAKAQDDYNKKLKSTGKWRSAEAKAAREQVDALLRQKEIMQNGILKAQEDLNKAKEEERETQERINDLQNDIKKEPGTIKKMFLGVGNKIKESKVGKAVTETKKAFKEKKEEFGGSFKGGLKATGSFALKGAAAGGKVAVKGLGLLLKKITPLIAILGIFKVIMEKAQEKFESLLEIIQKDVQPMIDDLWKSLESLINDILNLFLQIFKDLKPVISAFVDVFVLLFKLLVEDILMPLVKLLLPPLLKILATLVSVIGHVIKALGVVIQKITRKDGEDSIGKKLENVGSSMLTVAETMRNAADSFKNDKNKSNEDFDKKADTGEESSDNGKMTVIGVNGNGSGKIVEQGSRDTSKPDSETTDSVTYTKEKKTDEEINKEREQEKREKENNITLLKLLESIQNIDSKKLNNFLDGAIAYFDKILNQTTIKVPEQHILIP